MIVGIGFAFVELPNQFTDEITQQSGTTTGSAAEVVLRQFALSLTVKLLLEVPLIALRFGLRRCCCAYCCCFCTCCTCTCYSRVYSCLRHWLDTASAAASASLGSDSAETTRHIGRMPHFDCDEWLRLLKGMLHGVTISAGAKLRSATGSEMSKAAAWQGEPRTTSASAMPLSQQPDSLR